MLYNDSENPPKNLIKHIIHLKIDLSKLTIENICISASRRHAIQISWPVTNDGQIDASNLVAGHWTGWTTVSSEASGHLLEDQGLSHGHHPARTGRSIRWNAIRQQVNTMFKPWLDQACSTFNVVIQPPIQQHAGEIWPTLVKTKKQPRKKLM